MNAPDYENDFAYSSQSYEISNKWHYDNNCFGYALGIKRWLLVQYFHSKTNKKLAQHFEAAFQLTPVKKQDMVLGKEYLAMRFDSKSVYHFVWRGKKGHWRHKMASKQVESISQKEVFSKYWLRRYHGSIYLYEFQRNKMIDFFEEC